MWTKRIALVITDEVIQRTSTRTNKALLKMVPVEGVNPSVLVLKANIFEVQEVLLDTVFIRDAMFRLDHTNAREQDPPAFLLLMKMITNLMRTFLNYVILASLFFARRNFCTVCGALRVILQQPNLEESRFLVSEEYSVQRFHGQYHYEKDHLVAYFQVLGQTVEECLRMADIMHTPPAARPAPAPNASEPSVNGVLPDEVDDATSEYHARDGVDNGEIERDTYLALNLFPPEYESDCMRGRNGATSTTDPAVNDTEDVADNFDAHRLLRSMISVGGYCPICGCAGVGYQKKYSTDAANAEGSDEFDGAGGVEPMNLS